jgi:solute carrier family 25 (mitochondrial carnitine/acylcarnitine transporter), member 20/29
MSHKAKNCSNEREREIETHHALTACARIPSIQVRLQIPGAHFSGPFDCVRQTVAREGYAGLYRGMGPPLVAEAFTNAIIFGVFGAAKRYMLEHYAPRHGDELSVGQTFLAGSLTGVATTAVLCPMELVKSRLQLEGVYGTNAAHSSTQSRIAATQQPKSIGPLRMVARVVQMHGVMGLYRGVVATWLRDVPSFGLYFATYDLVKQNMPHGATQQILGGYVRLPLCQVGCLSA